MERDREATVSNNTAHSAESTSSMTPWLTPWTWYYSSTSVLSDTAPNRAFGADGVEPHSHEEKTGAINLKRNHEAQDGAREFSSSSSVTTTMQTPATLDPSSLNHMHNKDSLHDSPIYSNPVLASTITSHASSWAPFFSSRSLVVKSLIPLNERR